MKKFFWKINRLRVMSMRELIFRINREVITKAEKYFVSFGWKPQTKEKIIAKTSLFKYNSDLIRQWNELFTLNESGIKNYLANKIDFFNHKPLDIGTPVNWHRDPITQTVLPHTFGKTLNYRDDKIAGNVKFVWELGRHQHLIPIAVAYAATGEQHYRNTVTEQIESWIMDNPYGMGIHWCSSLEAALRLISWSLIHSLFVLRDGEKGLFSAVDNSVQLGESIFQQAWFIRHFLSLYSSANNHLIGELTGLWVACQVFDLGKRGEEWSSFAQNSLEREAVLQVYRDGVNKEQAFYYHLWVLEYLLFAWTVGTRVEKPFSDTFVNRIVAMSGFLKDVSPDNTAPPMVGDADDGFVSRFEPVWPQQPYSELLAAVEVTLGESSEIPNQKAFWYRAILGNTPQNSPKLNWARSYPVKYPVGGYAMLGDQSAHIVFDAGSLGYLGIAAHGHADALSFTLAIDGLWWLVDPGTYAYHSKPDWRNYFRGTAAHNTVIINNENQSVIGGAFMWLRKADARLEDVLENSNMQIAKGWHNGYQHLGVKHCREIQYSPSRKELMVIDYIEGGNATPAEIHFHFSPDIELMLDKKEYLCKASHKNSHHQLSIHFDENWELSICKGETNPILGWYSPSLEHKVETNTLYGKTMLNGKMKSITKIKIL